MEDKCYEGEGKDDDRHENSRLQDEVAVDAGVVVLH
jgi:hypothetical protein